MYQYVNEFSVAHNGEAKEVVITFRQSIPTINEKGEVSGIEKQDVSALIMPESCALALRDFLNKLSVPEK
ncbi:MAG: hypothetical protein K5990_06450 [Oscillospiraceae bacterium]|nr:hypothetical protein [Oscillospiraceae bacterium]